MACAVCVAHPVCKTAVGTASCIETLNRVKELSAPRKKEKIGHLLKSEILKKVTIGSLQHNNIFYYAGKVYTKNLFESFPHGMECHKDGKHKSFKPNAKVVFISPKFMKAVNKLSKLLS